MADSQSHILSRSTVFWLSLVALAFGLYVFFRAPQIPGIAHGWFAALAALGSFAASLISHATANYFANGQSRIRYILWCLLAIAVGIESGIRMAPIIGPLWGVVFGVVLAILLISLNAVQFPSDNPASVEGTAEP